MIQPLWKIVQQVLTNVGIILTYNLGFVLLNIHPTKLKACPHKTIFTSVYIFTVCCVFSCSVVSNAVTLWECKPPGSSVGFFRLEYWSGLPFPSPRDLCNPRIETRSPALQVYSLPLSHWEIPASFTNTKYWKQPQFSSIGYWINKHVVRVQKRSNDSTIKRNESPS